MFIELTYDDFGNDNRNEKVLINVSSINYVKKEIWKNYDGNNTTTYNVVKTQDSEFRVKESLSEIQRLINIVLLNEDIPIVSINDGFLKNNSEKDLKNNK